MQKIQVQKNFHHALLFMMQISPDVMVILIFTRLKPKLCVKHYRRNV